MYTKNICEYGVTIDANGVARLGDEVLDLVRGWREQLGAEHGLLDDYLRVVLTALSETMNANGSIEAGFDETLSDLRGLCRNVKEGSVPKVAHPFFPDLKSFTDTHSIPQDSLFYESCCVGIFGEYTVFAMHQFTEDCDMRMRKHLEKSELPKMREALIHSEAGLTANDIDGLLERIIHLFILVSPASVFMQGMVDQIITSLLLRDKPSGEYVFQRLLNDEI